LSSSDPNALWDWTLAAGPSGQYYYITALASGDITGRVPDDVGGAYQMLVGGTETPLPAALPLFASGLGALGVMGWRRKRKAAVKA
jgi:hypothetical protein